MFCFAALDHFVHWILFISVIISSHLASVSSSFINCNETVAKLNICVSACVKYGSKDVANLEDIEVEVQVEEVHQRLNLFVHIPVTLHCANRYMLPKVRCFRNLTFNSSTSLCPFCSCSVTGGTCSTLTWGPLIQSARYLLQGPP